MALPLDMALLLGLVFWLDLGALLDLVSPELPLSLRDEAVLISAVTTKSASPSLQRYSQIITPRLAEYARNLTLRTSEAVAILFR
jgi:hypothetical protein